MLKTNFNCAHTSTQLSQREFSNQKADAPRCERHPLFYGLKREVQRLFAAPESVQVAVFTGVDLLGVSLELSHGLVGRREILAQHLVVAGNEFYPLNVMGIGHGMLHLTNGNAVTAVNLLHHWNMLLGGAIGGILLKFA